MLQPCPTEPTYSTCGDFLFDYIFFESYRPVSHLLSMQTVSHEGSIRAFRPLSPFPKSYYSDLSCCIVGHRLHPSTGATGCARGGSSSASICLIGSLGDPHWVRRKPSESRKDNWSLVTVN